MKYEGHMKSEVGTSKIPLKVSSEKEAIAEFKILRLCHGKSDILSLHLIKTDDDGVESEINVP